MMISMDTNTEKKQVVAAGQKVFTRHQHQYIISNHGHVYLQADDDDQHHDDDDVSDQHYDDDSDQEALRSSRLSSSVDSCQVSP